MANFRSVILLKLTATSACRAYTRISYVHSIVCSGKAIRWTGDLQDQSTNAFL